MAAFGAMQTRRVLLTLLLLVTGLVFVTATKISDFRKCADKACTGELSIADWLSTETSCNSVTFAYHSPAFWDVSENRFCVRIMSKAIQNIHRGFQHACLMFRSILRIVLLVSFQVCFAGYNVYLCYYYIRYLMSSWVEDDYCCTLRMRREWRVVTNTLSPR